MPNPISCDCTPPARVFTYGVNQPVEVADARSAVLPREYYQDQTISEFELPYCKTIGTEGFRESSIQGIIVPQCEIIDEYAFYNTPQLGVEACDFSSVKTVGQYAFANKSTSGNFKSEFLFPSIETIGIYAFEDFRSTGTGKYLFDITNVKTIGDRAFSGSVDIYYYPSEDFNSERILYLPNCETIGDNVFRASTSAYGQEFYKIILPAIKTIGNYCWQQCGFTSAATQDSPGVMVFGPNCASLGSRPNLYYCSSRYWDIYCYATTPPSLGSAFAGSNNEQPQHIYVPAASVDAYKTAATWSSQASLITAMPQDHLTIDTWLL